MNRHLVASAVVSLMIGIGCDRAPSTDTIPIFEVTEARFLVDVHAEGNLEATDSTALSAPVDIPTSMTVAWLATEGGRIESGDVVVRFDPTEMEKRFLDGQTEQDRAGNRMVKERAASGSVIRNLELDASQSGLELEAAEFFADKDPELFARYQIIESSIDRDLATERRDHALASRDTRKTLSKTELELLEIEKRTAKIKMDQAKTGLDAVEVLAPHDGIVLFERDWRGNALRVGEQVWRGRQLGRIPDLSKMHAEVFVLEADAGGLAVGQTAEVIVESQPDVVYAAKVSRVDTLAKPRVPEVPVQYFGVTLELEKTDTAIMKPGQRVSAAIRTGDLAKVFAVPRQAIFDEDGKKVVHKETTSGYETVEVSLGSASLGRVVIESGVSVGDRLAMRDPNQVRRSVGDSADGDAIGANPMAPLGAAGL